ncbi:MAG: 16S rRNA methyltransferase, partial [Chloroflexota bacterium]
AHHASSAERLPILPEFYAAIMDAVGPVGSVLDLACGLNPLATPWMGLAPGTRYIACDMYADLIAYLGAALPLLGVDGEARLCDLAQPEALPAADVALILKTVPCLEQTDKAAGARLLAAAPAPVLVVTFPTHSLGRRDKGMPASYERRFWELASGQPLAGGQPWRVETLRFETELAFVVRR